MYSTCITCHAPLGANEMIEHFPVGRRLAIDAAKGRLWVVCIACKQWNLSPLDERWEAIEEGERLFRDTRLRVSTDNIGLARLRDGTELIRVGTAERPEFAAWRYGERFTRRWMINAPAAAVGGGLALFSKFGATQFLFKLGIVPGSILVTAVVAATLVRRFRKVAHLMREDGERVALTQAHVDSLRFIADDDEPDGWYLRVRTPSPKSRFGGFADIDPEMVVRGAEAPRVASRLLPRLNRIGGRKATVAEAVAVLERAGAQGSVLRMAGRFDTLSKGKRFGRYAEEVAMEDRKQDLVSEFSKAPASIRLATEMAVNEEQERRALEGELQQLTDQWKEAEEIAGIADELTLPPAVLARLERLRLR